MAGCGEKATPTWHAGTSGSSTGCRDGFDFFSSLIDSSLASASRHPKILFHQAEFKRSHLTKLNKFVEGHDANDQMPQQDMDPSNIKLEIVDNEEDRPLKRPTCSEPLDSEFDKTLKSEILDNEEDRPLKRPKCSEPLDSASGPSGPVVNLR